MAFIRFLKVIIPMHNFVKCFRWLQELEHKLSNWPKLQVALIASKLDAESNVQKNGLSKSKET